MNYNNIVVIGNITNDPILRQTATGKSVLNLSVATNKKQKDGTSTATFFECVAFEKIAENISRYFTKGKPIIVEGEMHQENWTTKSGEKRSKLVIDIWRWSFVGGTKTSTSETKQEATKVNTASQSDYIEDDDVPF